MCQSSDTMKEQYPDQCTGRICYDIVQLAIAPSGGKLDEFQKETAGESGKGTAQEPAECRKCRGKEKSEGDEHEDILNEKGMRPAAAYNPAGLSFT